jgi:exodeoxyribonuclease VII large subunit
LELLGPGAVLARGFSYTTDGKGKVLSRVSDVAPGAVIRTRLADGDLTSVVQ